MTILFVLTLASDVAVLYRNDALLILVRSTKKRSTIYFRCLLDEQSFQTSV